MNLILNTLGIIGATLIVGSYLLLNLGKMKGDTFSYLLPNVIGAAAVLMSMINSFNLAAFVIELFWLIVSLLGILKLSRINKKID